MRGAQFKTVNTPRIRRNKMELSHERRLTADMFFLYPILVDDCIPGDHWRVANEIVLRMNPLVAPIMHEINAYVHYFFVPYRLLWNDWENFITGGRDGNFVTDLPYDTIGNRDVESLWDYFGFNTLTAGQTVIEAPLIFPRRAYNLIYNEYYRDQNITDPVDLDYVNPATKDLHIRCWEKDYFTSMLPWQQRGDAPAMPIGGHLHVLGQSGAFGVSDSSSLSPMKFFHTGPNYTAYLFNQMAADNVKGFVEGNLYVDMSNAATFDVSDLRLAFQIQKFLERNARTGVRYVEFLKAHFPAWPRDDRLQRPEYVGGSKTPIVVSEVLQTSSTDSVTPQGNMAGHGLSADRTFVGSFRVQEFGLIMGIMSIMPRALYSQGIDRVWLKKSKYDFYFPEFSNLSEQAVYTPEIYNYGPAPMDKVIGYQGRYDEYRFKRSTVHGKFRSDFDYWIIDRKFDSAPTLNLDLVRPNAAERFALKRVMAVPSEPMFLITFGNRCHVTRPMPYIAEPGLIDHG